MVVQVPLICSYSCRLTACQIDAGALHNATAGPRKAGCEPCTRAMPLGSPSASGWGLVAVGVLMVLHIVGLNIQPLLTVGGVGGLRPGWL